MVESQELLTFVAQNKILYMTATINLSVDVPQSYSITLLKQQLTEYAQSLIASRASVEDATPYTVEELNARIDRAEAGIVAGKVLSRTEASQRMKEYLSKYL